ncbi:MAG: aspartate--tRNA ligase, partial [Alphaproteobacteria bacterium]|nr:aspartate--tRNA ligase [Alphaproteobacteria bacterium]
MHQYRTHNCGALRQNDVDAEVRLSGWVHRKRDHGNLLFVDLRDHYGLTQIVVDTSHDVFPILEGLSNESTVCVTGKVVKRSDETINPNMATGEIEVVAEQVEVLSRAEQLPMPVNKDAGYPEDIRLKYRFLDLRREEMQKNIKLRSDVISSIRRRMIDQGFNEYQTPILTASSPEGARDFLVPSRLHPGKFYALPQAPQQFKQLLMIAGFDRYFQIAPCFRDEDARADRSPGEFYQLDFEMSYVTQEDVFEAIEPVLHGVFEEFADGREVSPLPFKRVPYAESMAKYGSDKPDLRNPLIINDVSEAFAGSDFKVFANLVAKGMVVKAIPAPSVSDRPRSFFDKLNSWAQSEGQAGLGYINFKEDGAAGPIAKNLDDARLAKIKEITGVSDGDAVFFVCGKEKDAAEFAGVVRSKLGNDLELIDQNKFEFCWIVDFPMFEFDEKLQKVDFSHNPFSMPQGGMDALENQDPLTINAYQYDIVCNGIELSSGAIRNHLPE